MNSQTILHPGAKTEEEGYHFVLIEYTDGRAAYSEKKFPTKQIAESYAEDLRNRPRIKRATVHYQASLFDDVDIKKYI